MLIASFKHHQVSFISICVHYIIQQIVHAHIYAVHAAQNKFALVILLLLLVLLKQNVV